MQTAFITGAKGFIGSHLTNRLINDGVNVETWPVDILKLNQLLSIDNVDVVFHLAAKTRCVDPNLISEINIKGTLNVLEHCRMKDIKKMVFASSYLYGIPERLPIDEDHWISLTNPYFKSKKVGEDIARSYSEVYGIDVVSLRLFNIYGPGQKGDMLVPSVIRQLSNPVIIMDDPEPRRDMLFVSDAVDAFVKAGNSQTHGFNVFNIGYGHSWSVGHIVSTIVGISGLHPKVVYRYIRRKDEVMDVIADTRKAKRILGWEPTTILWDGLAVTVS